MIRFVSAILMLPKKKKEETPTQTPVSLEFSQSLQLIEREEVESSEEDCEGCPSSALSFLLYNRRIHKDIMTLIHLLTIIRRY